MTFFFTQIKKTTHDITKKKTIGKKTDKTVKEETTEHCFQFYFSAFNFISEKKKAIQSPWIFVRDIPHTHTHTHR